MRAAGTTPAAGRAARWGALVRRASRLERFLYSSIWRAITRRPAIAPGARGFGFHKAVVPILLVFIGLNGVELFVLDLLLRPWPPVRIVVDILDAWGLVWMVGLLCAYVTHPHTMGDDGIRVRNGLDVDIHVDWANVHTVRRSTNRVGTKTPRVTETDGIRELALRSQNETNLRIDLNTPMTVTLPGSSQAAIGGEIDRIRFWADDPDAFLEAARDLQ